ncbi:MAG: SAM-dependent methyltransferase [Rubrivivax sp.]|nr:SAM-dependent methyltransferase [Rubrivivax sp.]
MAPVNHTPADPARARFLQRLADATHATHAAGGPAWQRLLLAKPVASAAGADLQRVLVRPLLLRGQMQLSFVYSHTTKDITKNLPLEQGLAQVAALLGPSFRNAHLDTATEAVQLVLSKKGKGHLTAHGTAAPVVDTAASEAAPAAHDRARQRWLALDRPFLAALGVATAQGTLVPAMARKWKQINKFVEIFAHALSSAGLADKPGIEVVDFGAGRAYLTFAVHDWLTHTRGQPARVTGVELRPDLVDEGNASIARLGLQGLRLQQGDVRDWRAEPMDVMIALHACDTATDHAIHLGLQAGAQVILCSPCCHKQLRPQLLSPHPLRSVFQHGIHAEQQAEMLTDSLRALLLESRGYETRVFEFVALEHTRKNKMILAVRRTQPQPAAMAGALAQVGELKRYFGVTEQALEALLGGPDTAAVPPVPRPSPTPTSP